MSAIGEPMAQVSRKAALQQRFYVLINFLLLSLGQNLLPYIFNFSAQTLASNTMSTALELGRNLILLASA